jgi:hypothetical protein
MKTKLPEFAGRNISRRFLFDEKTAAFIYDL